MNRKKRNTQRQVPAVALMVAFLRLFAVIASRPWAFSNGVSGNRCTSILDRNVGRLVSASEACIQIEAAPPFVVDHRDLSV